MGLTPKEIDGLLVLIGLTRNEEINCDECLDLVAEFAEQELAGRSVPEGLEAVRRHISICTECREEYEALGRALAGLET